MQMVREKERVLEFVKSNPSCYRIECAGGTGVQRDVVNALLDELVADGTIIATEGERSKQTFRAATYTPPVPEPAPTDRRSAAQIWSDEARTFGLAEWNREHPAPKPEPRHVITDAEIAACIPPPVKPLTEAERKDYEISHRDRRPVNPQAFLRR